MIEKIDDAFVVLLSLVIQLVAYFTSTHSMIEITAFAPLRSLWA